MRINVYSQELTKEVSLVSKKALDTGILYYGVRFILKSPDCLHSRPDDDDRSAITFWIPHAVSFPPGDLAKVFAAASQCVDTYIAQHWQHAQATAFRGMLPVSLPCPFCLARDEYQVPSDLSAWNDITCRSCEHRFSIAIRGSVTDA